MEPKKSLGKYWFWFVIWTIIMVMLLISDYRQYFWLALPGVCTHFAKAMDIIDADVKAK